VSPCLLLDVVKSLNVLPVPVAQKGQDLRFEGKSAGPQHLRGGNHQKNPDTNRNHLEGKEAPTEDGEIGGIQVLAPNQGHLAEESVTRQESEKTEEDPDQTSSGIRFLREVENRRQVKYNWMTMTY